MGRIVNPDSAGKERIRLTKGVVLAIRHLATQTDTSQETHDLAAFIVLALEAIAATIDVSVAAWEKRDYWVKADKFRMEWAWAGQMSKRLKLAILSDNWGDVATTSALVAQRLQKITVPSGHRLGRPWVGAWDELIKNNKK